MRHRARRTTLSLAAGVSVTVAAPTMAGPPKSQVVDSVAVGSGHRVIATMVVGENRFDVTLAQVTTTTILRTGRSCRKHAAIRSLTAIASSLQLDVAARVAGAGDTSYVYEPEGAGAYDSTARSLNLLLVSRGLARVNREHGPYRSAFLRAQRDARRAHRGIWACRGDG